MASKKLVRLRLWVSLIVVMLVFFHIVWNKLEGYRLQQAETIAALQLQRAALDAENQEIERKIAFAKTDEYVERVAREELELMYPGEIRYVASGT